jgi:hypothetical protein
VVNSLDVSCVTDRIRSARYIHERPLLREHGGLVKMTTSQAILARETVEASPRQAVPVPVLL